MKQDITITGHIPVKKNKWKYGRNGRVYKPQECVDFEENVRWEVIAQRIKNIDHLVTDEGIQIEAIFITGGKERDLDGMMTTIIDALQDAGVFENDKKVLRIVGYKNHLNSRKPKEEKAHITITAL